jgi:hypothetical protein
MMTRSSRMRVMAMPAISPDRRDPEMAKNVIFYLE